MISTTPPKVAGQVMRLCGTLLPGGRPTFVPVDIPSGCVPGECFFNVRAAVASAGRRGAYGWVI